MTKTMKPIIKFNNGNGAILCNHCSTIIKANLTKEERKGIGVPLLCNSCQYQELQKTNKTIPYDQPKQKQNA